MIKEYAIRYALVLCYLQIDVLFPSTWEYKAKYMSSKKYKTRMGRCVARDIVYGKSSISIYEYTTDLRENPFNQKKYKSLEAFLSSRIKEWLERYIRQNVDSYTYYENGQKRIDSEVFFRTLDAVENIRKNKNDMVNKFIARSLTIKVINKLFFI